MIDLLARSIGYAVLAVAFTAAFLGASMAVGTLAYRAYHSAARWVRGQLAMRRADRATLAWLRRPA